MATRRRRRFLALRVDVRGAIPVAWVDANVDDTWRVSCALVAQSPRAVVVREVRIALRDGVRLPRGGFLIGRLSMSTISRIVNFYVTAIPSYWAPAGAQVPPAFRDMAKVFPFLIGGPLPRKAVRPDPPPYPRRRGRRPLPLATLLDNAIAYARACKRPATRSRPVVAAARDLKQTVARTRDYLNRAREAEILTKPLRGQAGGELTPYGQDLLKTRRFEEAARRRARKVVPRRTIATAQRRPR